MEIGRLWMPLPGLLIVCRFATPLPTCLGKRTNRVSRIPASPTICSHITEEGTFLLRLDTDANGWAVSNCRNRYNGIQPLPRHEEVLHRDLWLPDERP